MAERDRYGSLWWDERAVSPVVGKLLAAGITLLFVAGMSTTLYGGVVPGYQAAAGDELGERVLATAVSAVESADPPVGGTVDTQRTLTLPATIDDTAYTLVLSNESLRLAHPDAGIGAETPLALPDRTTVAESRYHSGTDLVIRVDGPADNRTVRIENA